MSTVVVDGILPAAAVGMVLDDIGPVQADAIGMADIGAVGVGMAAVGAWVPPLWEQLLWAPRLMARPVISSRASGTDTDMLRGRSGFANVPGN